MDGDEEEILGENPNLGDEDEDGELKDLPEELKEGDEEELYDPDSKFH